MLKRPAQMNTDAFSGGFHQVFLSVGTAAQKTIYERMLPFYTQKYKMDFSVFADGDDGARIGSGGALLKALQACAAEGALQDRKYLLILTGGESKRAPGFALRGKALVPAGIGADGEPAAVLDRILENALLLAPLMCAGMLVCCGDIVLDLQGFSSPLSRSTAFCVMENCGVGARHGVMFPDKTGFLNTYLQKEPAAVLSGYASRYGMKDEVPVDAGWIYLSDAYLKRLSEASAALPDEAKTASNLFTDILQVNAAHTERVPFLCAGNRALREKCWQFLREFPLSVICLRQPFQHFGTPGEILANALLRSGGLRTQIINSDIAAEATAASGSLFENVQLSGNAGIGDGCLLTDISLNGAAVPPHTAVFGVRLQDGRFVSCVQKILPDPSAAGKAALEAWELPLYYPAASFTESYLRYQHGDNREKMSLAEITAAADPLFYPDWRQYLFDLTQTQAKADPVYEGYRDRMIAAHFSRTGAMERLGCVKDRVSIDLPVRINFSGTWTDCMPYCIDRGGEVINAAVKVNGRLPIRVTAERIGEKLIEMCNEDGSCAAAVYRPEEPFPVFSDCNLHRAVFRALGVDKNTVLRDGIRLTVSVSGIMKGSGLGTSSILLFSCFRALGDLLGLELTEGEALSYVFVAEQLMNTGGGWQDQSAMIGTGLKAVSSAPGLPQQVGVQTLPCKAGFLNTLSDRLVLVSTGQRHFGRFIVADVMNRYLAGDSRTLEGFAGLTALNAVFKDAIATGDLAAFARGMNLHAKNLDLLSPLIYNNIIKAISEKCLLLADGCSICGAGGGGYLAVLLKEGVCAQALQKALQTEVLPIEIL